MKRVANLWIIIGLWLLFLSLPVLAAEKKSALPQVSLEVRLDPGAHTLSGRARITLPQGKVTWIRVSNLVLKRVLLGKKAIRPELEDGRFRVLSVGKNEILEVHFTGYFPKEEYSRKEGFLTKEEGLLLGNWFPAPEGLAFYTLRISVPASYKVITSTEDLKVQKRKRLKTYIFRLFHPAPAPPLLVGRYEYYYRTLGNRTLALYLKLPDPELAQDYLNKTIEALKTYERLFGPYPYKRLSIVEVSREVGYSYPTLILLGSKVLRLPFIKETSLPHEVLHQWFGCGVYPAKGNWSEGLVTYFADYLQAERRQKGESYRKDLLVSHETWCKGEDPFPLIEFQRRTDRCTQALGYGKGAFFFHMLKKEVGPETFAQALKTFYSEFRYREADWEDLKRVFERMARRDLSDFFKQWLFRKGKPRLSLVKRYLIKDDQEVYRLGLTVYQEAPYFDLRVPLRVEAGQEIREEWLSLKGFKKEIELTFKEKPTRAVLDPHYEIWRALSEPELPPNLGRILASRGKIWVKREDWPVYKPFIHFLKRSGYQVIFDLPPEPASVRENLVYLGRLPEGLEFLFPDRDFKEGFWLEVKENPTFPERVILVARTKDRQEIEKVVNRLPHLWSYALLYFREGRTLEKEKIKGERGLVLNLEAEVTGLPLKKLLSLEDIARRVSLSRVIVVGEEHNRYEHHLAQLEIIRWFHEHGHRVAIGMEMFQRPFQKYLDQYLAGEIDEPEFLRRTEYFERWRYDWKLYRPILEYARQNRIPVIALNAPSEITKKVARSGLESLSLEEKAELPDIDQGNEAYKAYLYRIYKTHQEFTKEFSKFEYFYQAQLLWDETMAETAARWLSRNPDYQMIILAGKGHVMYGYGIPSRLKRRGLTSVATLILGGNEKITTGFADYLLYPEPVEPPFTARLGVWIEESDEGLRIARVRKGSPADKAGLKKDDVIVKADGQETKTIGDLKIILTFKEKGDHVEIEYLRKGQLHHVKITFE